MSSSSMAPARSCHRRSPASSRTAGGSWRWWAASRRAKPWSTAAWAARSADGRPSMPPRLCFPGSPHPPLSCSSESSSEPHRPDSSYVGRSTLKTPLWRGKLGLLPPPLAGEGLGGWLHVRILLYAPSLSLQQKIYPTSASSYVAELG